MMKRKVLKLIFIITILVSFLLITKSFGLTYYDNDSDTESDEMPILFAIFMELFVSIHMTVFVIIPLSHIIAKKNPRAMVFVLSVLRAFFLLYFDFFVTTSIAIVDFFAVFIGAFILVPLTFFIDMAISKGSSSLSTVISNTVNPTENKDRNESAGYQSDYYEKPSYTTTETEDDPIANDDDDDPIKFL